MQAKAIVSLFLVLIFSQNAVAASWESRQKLCADELIQVLKGERQDAKFVKNISRENEGATVIPVGYSAEFYLVKATVSGEVIAAAECFVQPRGKKIMRFKVTVEPTQAQRWVAART